MAMLHKMREESHSMRDACKQTKMPEFHGNCGKHGRSGHLVLVVLYLRNIKHFRC